MCTMHASRRVVETSRSGAVTHVSLVFSMTARSLILRRESRQEGRDACVPGRDSAVLARPDGYTQDSSLRSPKMPENVPAAYNPPGPPPFHEAVMSTDRPAF